MDGLHLTDGMSEVNQSGIDPNWNEPEPLEDLAKIETEHLERSNKDGNDS
jgi:hypothetical protein